MTVGWEFQISPEGSPNMGRSLVNYEPTATTRHSLAMPRKRIFMSTSTSRKWITKSKKTNPPTNHKLAVIQHHQTNISNPEKFESWRHQSATFPSPIRRPILLGPFEIHRCQMMAWAKWKKIPFWMILDTTRVYSWFYILVFCKMSDPPDDRWCPLVVLRQNQLNFQLATEYNNGKYQPPKRNSLHKWKMFHCISLLCSVLVIELFK